MCNLYKRRLKIRKKILKQGKYRLTVYKSNKHTYAQVFDPTGQNVIASCSTLDKDFKERIIKDNNVNLSKIEKANLVGDLLSAKLKLLNKINMAFDRSGFKFHGRIKAVADSVLKNNIIF